MFLTKKITFLLRRLGHYFALLKQCSLMSLPTNSYCYLLFYILKEKKLLSEIDFIIYTFNIYFVSY